MVHLGEQLHIDTQAAVHVTARLGDEPLSEFTLEHEYCTAEHGSVLEELENQGRRDLIRGVGNAQVEKGQLSLDGITLDELELVLIAQFAHSLGDFSDHAGINFDCNRFLASFQERGCKITRTGTDFKDNICGLDSRLLNDLLNHQRILQNVLTKRLIKAEVVTSSRCSLSHLLTLPFH